MILRRVQHLRQGDNVRLDTVLWNVDDVAVSADEVIVFLSRMVGDKISLHLRQGDFVQIA